VARRGGAAPGRPEEGLGLGDRTGPDQGARRMEGGGREAAGQDRGGLAVRTRDAAGRAEE
jgi:hypothetical protein